MVAIEVLAEDLDRDNGFNHVSLDFAASAARVVTCLQVHNQPRKKVAFDIDM